MRDVYFKTVQSGEESWDVFYCLNVEGSAHGVAHVDSSGITQDVPTVVELAAMRFLMCVKDITGSNAYGPGYHFFVSAPSIDRAAHSVSIKPHLSTPSHFLATRFKGAVITNATAFEWMNSWNFPKFREFEMKARDHAEELVHCPLLRADVIISRHALERQVTRFDAALEIAQSGRSIETIDVRYWTSAWRSLQSRLKSPPLKMAQLDDKERRSLLIEYGSDVVILTHDSHKQVFVLVPALKGRYVLVTVFPFSSLSKYAAKIPRMAGQRLIV